MKKSHWLIMGISLIILVSCQSKQGSMEPVYKTELVEDLISIIHHYSAKLYSNRKELKEIEKIIKESEINNI